MRIVSLTSLAGAVAAVLAAVTPSLSLAENVAQTRPATQRAGSATAPAAIDPKAQQLLQKAAAAYRSLHSYQDEGRVRLETVVDGKPQTFTAPASLIYARPNKFAATTQALKLYCDGKTVVLYAHRKGRYLRTSADDLSNAAGDPGLVRWVNSQPILPVLLHPADSVLAERDIVRATYEGQAEINGRKSHHLVLSVRPPAWLAKAHGSAAEGKPIRKDLYIDAETHMLTRLVVDETEAIKALFSRIPNAAPDRIERLARRFDAGRIRLDEPIPSEAFVPRLPEEARRVDTLLGLLRAQEPTAQAEDAAPAPDFALSDLAGKQVKLADYRGKVVLLDFWATWCPPCREELPHIEKIHRDLAAKGLVVLGMNLGEPAETVRNFVQQNKLTFRVLLDTQGKAAEAYDVEGIPHVVLIDHQGRVRETQSGYAPGMEKQLREKIERLLAAPATRPAAPTKPRPER